MDVIGMTNLQEAKLAREAEICYVTIAMVTDYDCWHPRSRRGDGGRHHRESDARTPRMRAKLIAAAVRDMPAERDCKCGTALSHAMITDRKTIPEATAQEAGAAGWKVSVGRPSVRVRGVTRVCLRGKEWTAELLDRALAIDDGRAFLSIVVERLGDLFEPRLCEVYAALFAQAIERVSAGARSRVRRGPIATPEAPACGGTGLRSVARDTGRRRRRHQRAAGCREAAISARRDRFRRAAKML